MTGKEAYARQIAEVKAHMGELRSADGKSVERLLAARAAEPTRSQVYHKDLVHITIGPFKLRWFLDVGEWFVYVHWRSRWWRFSSVGFCKSVSG